MKENVRNVRELTTSVSFKYLRVTLNLCDSFMEEALHFIYRFGRELQVFLLESSYLAAFSSLRCSLVRVWGCCQLLNMSISAIC